MVQHSALMRRALMFRELAVIEVSANIVSALAALTVAFFGYGYWALVLRPLATPSLISLGLWLKCRWLPGRPGGMSGVFDTLKFGFNITGFALLDFAGKSSDRIAIGYSRGAAVLGQYQNALFIYDNFLDVLVIPLHGVAVASLSKLRGNLHEMRRLWARALSGMAFYAMPAFGLLALTGGDLVVVLLGAKWQAAGTLVSVLALRGIPHSVERTLGWLHVASGRTDRLMRWGLFATAAQVLVLLFGLPFGPMGVVTAYVIMTFAMAVPTLVYAGKPIGITAADVTRSVWRQTVASLVAAGIGFLLRWTVLADLHPLLSIGALAVVYLATYLMIVIGILRVHAPVRAAHSLLRAAVPARFARSVS
jgi:PST family polysaccharide transporter